MARYSAAASHCDEWQASLLVVSRRRGNLLRGVSTHIRADDLRRQLPGTLSRTLSHVLVHGPRKSSAPHVRLGAVTPLTVHAVSSTLRLVCPLRPLIASRVRHPEAPLAKMICNHL